MSDKCGKNQWGVQLTPGLSHFAPHDEVGAGAVGEHVKAAIGSGELLHDWMTASYLPTWAATRPVAATAVPAAQPGTGGAPA